MLILKWICHGQPGEKAEQREEKQRTVSADVKYALVSKRQAQNKALFQITFAEVDVEQILKFRTHLNF